MCVCVCVKGLLRDFTPSLRVSFGKDVLYDNREVVSRAERYHLPAQAAIDARVLERCGLVGYQTRGTLAKWPSNSSRRWADQKNTLLVNGTCHVTGKLENIMKHTSLEWEPRSSILDVYSWEAKMCW